jgi:hypothetical protein
MSGKSRLHEWALWRLEPAFHFPVQNPLERIKEDRENAGAGADGFHYDVVGPTDDDPETVACMPDGGLGDMIDRMAGSIDHDKRCREINALVTEMRHRFRDYWNLVDVTFSGTHPRDIMKGAEVSARILGIEAGTYRDRMRLVYEWVEARLGHQQTKGSKRHDERYRRSA